MDSNNFEKLSKQQARELLNTFTLKQEQSEVTTINRQYEGLEAETYFKQEQANVNTAVAALRRDRRNPFKRAKWRANKYKEILAMQANIDSITELGVNSKQNFDEKIAEKTDTSLDVYLDTFVDEFIAKTSVDLNLVKKKNIKTPSEQENYQSLLEMMNQLNSVGKVPKAEEMREIYNKYKAFRDTNPNRLEAVSAQKLYDSKNTVDAEKIFESPKRCYAFLYNCVSTSLFDLVNRFGAGENKLAIDKTSFSNLYAMKLVGDQLATIARNKDYKEIENKIVDDLTQKQNVADEELNKKKDENKINEIAEESVKIEEVAESEEKQLDLSEEEILKVFNGEKEVLDENNVQLPAVKWVIKGKFLDYARAYIKTKAFKSDREVRVMMEKLNTRLSYRIKHVGSYAVDKSYGIKAYRDDLTTAILDKFAEEIITQEDDDLFIDQIEEKFANDEALTSKANEVKDRIAYAKDKLFSMIGADSTTKEADKIICKDSIFAALLYESKDMASYKEMIDKLVATTENNIEYLSKLVAQNSSPFIRDELLVKMKASIGMDLVTKSPAAIKYHTQIVMGSLMSRFPELAARERQVKELVAGANLPFAYRDRIIDMLYKKQKTVDEKAIKAVLAEFSENISKNEESYLNTVKANVRLTRAQWRELEEYKKTLILDSSMFANRITEKIIEYNKTNSANPEVASKLEFFDKNIVANIRKQIEEKEALDLGKTMADKLKGKFLCQNVALLDKEGNSILSESDQTLVLECLNEILKSKDNMLTIKISALNNVTSLEDLDNLSISEQNEFITLVQANLLSKVERWTAISGPYASRLKKDMMIEMLKGMYIDKDDQDFDQSVAFYSQNYEEDTKVAQKRIDVIISNPEMVQNGVNYVYTDVVAYEKKMFKSDQFIQAPRVERLAYAQKAWEYIYLNRLDNAAMILANMMSSDHFDEKKIVEYLSYKEITREKGEIYDKQKKSYETHFDKEQKRIKVIIENKKTVIKKLEDILSKNDKTIEDLRKKSDKIVEKLNKQANDDIEAAKKRIKGEIKELKKKTTLNEQQEEILLASKIKEEVDRINSKLEEDKKNEDKRFSEEANPITVETMKFTTQIRAEKSAIRGYKVDLAEMERTKARAYESMQYKNISLLYADDNEKLGDVVNALDRQLSEKEIQGLRDVFKKVATEENWHNGGTMPDLKDYLYEFMMLGCGANMVSKGGVLGNEFIGETDKVYDNSIKVNSYRINQEVSSLRNVLDNKFEDVFSVSDKEWDIIKEKKGLFIKRILPIFADLRDVNIDNSEEKKRNIEYNLVHYGVTDAEELVKYVESKSREEIEALISVQYVNKKVEIEGKQVEVKELTDASGKQLDSEKMPIKTFAERKQILSSYEKGIYKPVVEYLINKPEVFSAMMKADDANFEKYLSELKNKIGPLVEAIQIMNYKHLTAIFDQYLLNNFDLIWNNEKKAKTVDDLILDIHKYSEQITSYKVGKRDSIDDRLSEVAKQKDDKSLAAKIFPLFASDPTLWSSLFRLRDLQEVIDAYESRNATNGDFLKTYESYKNLSETDKVLADQFFSAKAGTLNATDFKNYISDKWKEFDNLRKSIVIEKPDQKKIAEEMEVLKKIQTIKSKGEEKEKLTKITLDKLREERYRSGSPIIARLGLSVKDAKFKDKYEKAKERITKIVDGGEVSLDDNVKNMAISMVADRMMGGKGSLKDADIINELNLVKSIYDNVKDIKRVTKVGETEVESELNELDINRLVLNAYGRELEYNNEGRNRDDNVKFMDQKRDAKAFIRNYDLLKKLEYIHFEDKSLAAEHASIIESLTIGLYTMQNEEFTDLLLRREKFLFGTDTVIGAMDAYELLEQRIELLTKDELKVNATPEQVAEFEQKKDRIRLGFHDYLRAAIVEGITKEQLIEDFDKVFSNKTMLKFIIDSGSLMGSVAYDDLTVVEKPTVTSFTRKDAEEKFEKADKKKFAEYEKMSMEERRIFFMALSMPGIDYSGEASDNAKLLKNQKLDKDKMRVYQNALLNYAQTRDFNPPIDYDHAMYHLFIGDKLNTDMYNSAMRFVLAVKNAIKEETPKDCDMLGDGLNSYNVAVSLMKGGEQKKYITETHKKVTDKLNANNTLEGFKDALLSALDFDTEGNSDGKLASAFDAIKHRVKDGSYFSSAGLKKRLAGIQTDLDWKMLLLILQNRTALDFSTDDEGFSLGSKVTHFVNENLRAELVDTLTDENSLLQAVTDKNEILYSKAMETLCSFKLKDHTDFSKKLSEDDFTNLGRETVIDWGLLNEALDLLDNIKEEQRRVTLVRNATRHIEYSANDNTKAAFYKYEQNFRKNTQGEDKSMSSEDFDGVLKDYAKNDYEKKYEPDVPELIAGYMNLNSNEKILFIRALEHRDILDVSKQGFWASFFGQSERNFVSEKSRDNLITEYIENTLSDTTSMKVGKHGYNNAILSLLSTQMNDSVDPAKVTSVEDLAAKGFAGDKRQSAIDWKLFRRALQFVKRTSNERECMLGDMEIYLAHGDLSKGGRFSFASQYLRQNLHQSGNRWTRFFGRHGADAIKDLVPFLGLASKVLLTALDTKTRTKMAGYHTLEPEVAEKTGWAAKNDLILQHSETVGNVLQNETIQGYIEMVIPEGAVKGIGNIGGGIVMPGLKDISGVLDAILTNDGAVDTTVGVVGAVGDMMMSGLSNKQIQSIMSDKGVSDDLIKKLENYGGGFAGRILKHGAFIVEKGKKFYEMHTNRKEFKELKNEVKDINVEEQNAKLFDSSKYTDERSKKIAVKEILKNQKLTEVAMDLTKSTMNEDLISEITGFVSDILDDKDIFNAFGLDLEADDLPLNTVENFLVQNSARIIKEIGATINAIHRLCTDKTMIKNYYSSEPDGKSGPYAEEIEKLNTYYKAHRNEFGLDDINLHKENSDIAERANGFEGFDEHAGYVALNLVRAILFGASRYAAGDEITILRSRGIMSALGMKDDIGKTDSATAQKLYEKISGKEYK